MKKLLLLAAITISSLSLNAQIDAGTFMVGGSGTFNHHINHQVESSSTSLYISPQVGFAFADNFVAGAWFGFSSFSSVSSWSVGPFVRYYMNNFFAGVGYGYSRYDGVGYSQLNFDLGYAIFLNDNVALEPALYYTMNFDDGIASSDLGARIGLQIYLNR